jgi:hypothetical protein
LHEVAGIRNATGSIQIRRELWERVKVVGIVLHDDAAPALLVAPTPNSV